MRLGFNSLVIVTVMLGMFSVAAPIPKDEQIEIAKCHADLEGEWTCCNRKSEYSDLDNGYPDKRGNSCHLLFQDHHLSLLDRNRDGKITDHECCDFELRKFGSRILLIRSSVTVHKGGINQYSPTFLIDFHKAQIKLIFYVKNDSRGGFADIAADKITDDYHEVVWTYNPVKKKQ